MHELHARLFRDPSLTFMLAPDVRGYDVRASEPWACRSGPQRAARSQPKLLSAFLGLSPAHTHTHTSISSVLLVATSITPLRFLPFRCVVVVAWTHPPLAHRQPHHPSSSCTTRSAPLIRFLVFPPWRLALSTPLQWPPPIPSLPMPVQLDILENN